MSTAQSEQDPYCNEAKVAPEESHKQDEISNPQDAAQFLSQPHQGVNMHTSNPGEHQVVPRGERETNQLSNQVDRPAGGSNRENGAHVTFMLPEMQTSEEEEEVSENKENEAPDDNLPRGITILVLRKLGQREGLELLYLLAELANLMKHVHWFQSSDDEIPLIGDSSPEVLLFHDSECKQQISKKTDDMVRDVFQFIRKYTPYIEIKELVRFAGVADFSIHTFEELVWIQPNTVHVVYFYATTFERTLPMIGAIEELHESMPQPSYYVVDCSEAWDLCEVLAPSIPSFVIYRDMQPLVNIFGIAPLQLAKVKQEIGSIFNA